MKNLIRSQNYVHLSGLVCFALVLLFVTQSLHAQSWSYPNITMEGDTILQTFPPQDSIYVHNRLILKFRPGILNKDSLCYDCDAIVELGTRGKGALPQDAVTTEWFAECKETVMTQKFSLNIISDPVARSILSANGVSYLTRMTAANPCSDTLSITRFGDTIPMDQFNWMVATYNNDTGILPTLVELYFARATSVQVAEPDFYISSYSPRFPKDPQFDTAPQTSLTMMGMPFAWEFDVGDSNIILAIVDHGLDYWRCDLGGQMIPNDKVIGGWRFCGYVEDTATIGPKMQGIYFNSNHGTQVASIAAALTNNKDCGGLILSPTYNGMAGIGGGWDSLPKSRGVKLLGYGCDSSIEPNIPQSPFLLSFVAAAILEATANSAHGPYGSKADVVNFSGGDTTNFITLRDAVAEAFFNGATLVVAKGNNGNSTRGYPSSYEPPSEVVAVGCSDRNYIRLNGSNTGENIDLIAPGGEQLGINSIALGLQWDQYDSRNGASTDTDQFAYFGATSAAAPHVSGQVSLLRGFLQNHGKVFAREDLEGILKASAMDIDSSFNHDFLYPRGQYLKGYDTLTGWGFTRADTMFSMLGNENYVLMDIEVPDSLLRFGAWSDTMQNKVFFNPNEDTTKDTTNNYTVRVREVTATASYAGHGFDVSQRLYAWGNTGIDSAKFHHRGRAYMFPNWQEPWCELVADSLNRDLGNGYVPGIHHNYSTDVKIHTYQYAICNSAGVITSESPDSASVGMGFTVFGALMGFSGVQSSQSSNGTFSVWPSIATNVVQVSIDNSARASRFQLVDALGRVILNESLLPGTSRFDVNTSDLQSGIYIGRLMTETGNEEAKIIVRH